MRETRNTKADLRCRTCFDCGSKVHALDDGAADGKSLADLLMDIAKIDTKQEPENGLPRHLCDNCAGQLRNAYAFVLQAQKVNEQLLTMLLESGKEVKNVDCLLEKPIDLPLNPNQFLQVKLEAEEENVYDALYAVDVQMETDSMDNDFDNDDRASSISPKLEENATTFASVAEEKPSCSSNPNSEVNDPITINKKAKVNSPEVQDPITIKDKTRFKVQKDKRKSLKEANSSSESDSDSSDGDYIPPKRGRGRPPLLKNVRVDKEGRFMCDVCGKTFAWRKDLQRHSNSHFATPRYECDLCERKFMRKDKLNDHLKIHEKQGKSEQRVLRGTKSTFAERLYNDKSFRLIQCKLCGDSDFKSPKALRQHLAGHENADSILLQAEDEIAQELCPSTSSIEDLKISIVEDIKQQRFSKYYAVVNEYGYEMCLSDSDADEKGGEPQEEKLKYQCELCQKWFNRKHKVFSHIKEQHANAELPYKCTVCKLEFVSEPMFESHTNAQCRSKEKKYQCLKCPGKFMWLRNLNEHKCCNRSHTPELKDKVPNKRGGLQCKVCHQAFKRLKDLKRHAKSHEDEDDALECPLCLERFVDLKQHIRESHEELSQHIECCLCGLKFEKLSELRLHLPRHEDGLTEVLADKGEFFKVHYPDGCDSTEVANVIANDFNSRNLTRFYAAINDSGDELDLDDSETESETEHTTEYKCEVCSKLFERRKRLLMHQQSAHSEMDSLPYACSNCSKPFVCSALLQQHITRDCLNTYKQHQCDVCGSQFVWKANLERHVKIKHADPEDQSSRPLAKKLHCEECDKVFIWPKDLIRHKRVHLPDDEKYGCPYCERKFNRKDNMQSHLKVHGEAAAAAILKKDPSKIKPAKVKGVDVNLCKPNGCKVIQCMICLSKHSKIADLRTHLRTHQYKVSFAARQQPIKDICSLLYPDLEPPLSESELIQRIISDITQLEFERFYSITNEMGYELSLTSSETESDSDNERSDSVLELDHSTRSTYRCDLCKLSFKRKYKLYEHQMTAHDWSEAAYTCTHCKTRFLSKELLQHHYDQQCKNLQKRFLCKKCPQRFMWKDNLKYHCRINHLDVEEIKKEIPRSFDCQECHRSFLMQKDLTRHMLMHRNDASVFKCLWCPRKFYRKENLHMHVKRHGVKPEQIKAAECIITSTKGPNGSKRVLCKPCNVGFDSIAALKCHLQLAREMSPQTHHDLDSLANYSITNELGFELHLEDSETEGETDSMDKPYACEICRLKCRRKFEMAQHQRSCHKHEQLPQQCEKCVFKTVSANILDHHKKTQCFNEQKQLQCQQCFFKFMWPENLENHIQLMHPVKEEEVADDLKESSSLKQSKSLAKDKIFECDQCNRKYNRKDRLTAHIKKKHSEAPAAEENAETYEIDPVTGETIMKKPPPPKEKKFLCAFCGRAVTSSSNLIIHMRRHTGEKPFKCDFCDMAFPRSSDLNCHRRKHTGERPHKCTVCDKAFSRSYKLMTHMRIHSGEKPYKCTYCEKSFAQSNDLTLHIRRHTGERPYVCGICGERFIQGTALKNHRVMRGHFEEIEPRRPAGTVEPII